LRSATPNGTNDRRVFAHPADLAAEQQAQKISCGRNHDRHSQNRIEVSMIKLAMKRGRRRIRAETFGATKISMAVAIFGENPSPGEHEQEHADIRAHEAGGRNRQMQPKAQEQACPSRPASR